jgi:hypothetical protein
MKTYKSKYGKIPGTNYKELMKNARKIYHEIEKQTNRTPYIRSNKHSYFKGEKIFLNMFFPHLGQKSQIDRKRRLKFFEAGLDLVKNTNCPPTIKPNPNKKAETFYRFTGETFAGEIFRVQVKANKRGNRYLMSIYPPE